MNIQHATEQYEAWLSKYSPLIADDLDFKHQQMRADIFSFLRATYYRWVQLWPAICANLADAPTVPAVGDLHVANFGTWRDREGRLCWGVNDFDVAYPLPYTHDLTRLSTSALLAIEVGHLRLHPADACSAILRGYTECVQTGGQGYVLAEQHGWLRDLAVSSLKKPEPYWKKMDSLADVTDALPETAKAALELVLPLPGMPYDVKHRVAGLGSLGLPRFVAVGEFEDGRVAREAKAMVPSAIVWASSSPGAPQYHYQSTVEAARRSHDPFARIDGSWIVRRLAPDCTRVELTALPDPDTEAKLLHAMGKETANVHVGSPTAIPAILLDLSNRADGWLKAAAESMVTATVDDWHQWQNL